MSTASTTSSRTAPTDLPTWAIQTADLEAMLATDDDTVDTAVIPRLAYRDAVEEAAAPGQSLVTVVELYWVLTRAYGLTTERCADLMGLFDLGRGV